MKLATRIDGSRDGQLVVVSRDLATAHLADAIAPTLQRALDDWSFIAPQLEDLYTTLNQGKARHAFAFDPRQCAAPLPRAYQWLDASAYPSLRQGASDDFLGPLEDARFASEDWGIDFEAGVAAITDDVPSGSAPASCEGRIRLLALCCGWVLRTLAAGGPGAQENLQDRPWTAFSPVAATVDEFGHDWHDGRPHCRLTVHCNGRKVGEVDAGKGLACGFGEFIARAARTRNLRAGTVVGAGAAFNSDPARGGSSLAQVRAIEIAQGDAPHTMWRKFGDRVRIEMPGADGLSIFGAIDQEVAPARA